MIMEVYKFLIWILFMNLSWPSIESLGVNWGTIATHQLPPKTVAQMLRDNSITKVKLFDADPMLMSALAGTGIELTIAIPNDRLAMMGDYDAAKSWVKENVTRYNFDGGVNIIYVAVGNEPFLKAYNGTFNNVTFPALQNIQRALDEAGAGDAVKATIPINADVYDSPPSNPVPSAGRFRADILDLMTKIVAFYNNSGAPFTVNIYPFLSLYETTNFPADYAFFDGTPTPLMDNGIPYTSVFDANYDTLVSALKDVGSGDMPIIVGEVGWPTDGDANAKTALAERFYNGLLKKLNTKQGTPLRPNASIEVYLFGLLDEDTKSILPGSFERHWGIFTYDGRPKFPMDLTGQGESRLPIGAKNVEYLPAKWCMLDPNAQNLSKLEDNVNYACNYADCTSLENSSMCGALDTQSKASYAFNAYFQMQGQKDMSCYFDGLAVVTTQNISQGACNFTIQIAASSSSSLAAPAPAPSPSSSLIAAAPAATSPSTSSSLIAAAPAATSPSTSSSLIAAAPSPSSLSSLAAAAAAAPPPSFAPSNAATLSVVVSALIGLIYLTVF